MLQATSPLDSKVFSPARDIAHAFPMIADIVRNRMIGGKPWGDVRELLAKYGVTDEEAGQAFDAFAAAVCSSVDNPKEQLAGVLNRCGWFACSAPARVAVMASIGNVALGLFFQGVRQATLNGVGPCDTVSHFRDSADECIRVMRMSRWRRTLNHWRSKLWQAWLAFRQT